MNEFKKIEEKWQKKWEKEKLFEVESDSKKKKYYVLEMYAYPSGKLHMGHAFNYTIGDIYTRFKRMQGFNVLHPVGYDSFGLPAENAAIKSKSHPKKFTEEAIKNFNMQLRRLGFSYDWSTYLETHKPDYYKWDQWIFLEMLKKGLAYKKEAPVNWCPECKTVLANEQVHNGKCWRHSEIDVETKHLAQWFFKITDYADELLEDIDKLGYPEKIKAMQKNWIGKSYGTELEFEINGEKWPIFTTRPDTLFGVTFMVVSLQHPKLDSLVTKEQRKEVDKLLKKLKSTSQKDMNDLEKEGVFTGSYAINPANKEKIPVYAGNFVVADYGSGMVMAVPAHDQRDFEFAKKYKIEIRQVIEGEFKERAYVGDGKLMNSKGFDGKDNEKAKKEITKKFGKEKVQFRLKDWLISRQRFWGTPIPIIYCDKCGVVAEENLPVVLPENIKFQSESNPLKDYKPFVEVKCPKCKGKARRETDTMDTFVNSSWYFLRYCDSKNDSEIFDKKKVDYWTPVDLYIGGAEHACMHLIYYRYYTKFLRDIERVSLDEPVKELFNQGMVHGEDGFVMSKSRGNGVDPLEVIDKYSADILRFYLVSNASPDKDFSWNNKSIEGSARFIKKVFKYFSDVKVGKSSDRMVSKFHKTIQKVTSGLERLEYNMVVIYLRELFDNFGKEESKEVLEGFLKMMSTICPHLAEELWKGKDFISVSDWPVCDKKKINEEFERQDEAVEGLASDINNILKIVKDKKKACVYVIPKELELFKENLSKIESKTNLKIEIFSVSDSKKYDPENKSKKAKPGRPAIYIE